MVIRYLIVPQIVLYKDNTRTLNNFQKLISSENGYSKIKEEIIAKNSQLHDRLSKVSNTGTDSRDLSAILELLIKKAKASDIRFVKMQPQEESKTQDYRLFPVVLDLKTTYHALGQFIASLESLPYMFKVDRLAMDAAGESAVEVKILVTCLIPLQGNI